MTRKFTVQSQGMIPGVGISGPITTPIPIEEKFVLQMIKSGMVVYEHNPYNISEKEKVTMLNIGHIKFSMGDGIKETKNKEEAIAKEQAMSIGIVHRNEQKKEDKKQNIPTKENAGKEEKVSKPDKFEKN